MNQGKKCKWRTALQLFDLLTILAKFIWTFGDCGKTQSCALASEIAWPVMV